MFFFLYSPPGAMEAENKRKCRICNVCCSSIVQLCEHVTGNKHKMKLGIAAPHQVKRLGTMQLFLDMHMKGEPILGLEYIVETLVDSVYAYNCQLCEVQGDWRKLVGHIVDTDHMTCYVDKHHPELSLGDKSFSRKGEHLRALREITKKILKITGRKTIQAHKRDPADLSASDIAEVDELSADSPSKSDDEKNESADSPKEESAAEARRRVARKRAPLRNKIDSATALKVARLSVAARRNGALAAKRALLRDREEPREYEREPNWTVSIQELEFRRNQDLLSYLRNYKIESDGDAHYIQQIVRNCTEALWRFREQQAREEGIQSAPPPPRSHPAPPAPYGYAGWNRPEGPCFPVSRMDPYPSGSQSHAPMPRQPSYAVRSPFPPSASAATEIFFNSIKNMEEGEVVNVFHKIAATNPAFRGINIPSVIQYLKDTGRLKP